MVAVVPNSRASLLQLVSRHTTKASTTSSSPTTTTKNRKNCLSPSIQSLRSISNSTTPRLIISNRPSIIIHPSSSPSTPTCSSNHHPSSYHLIIHRPIVSLSNHHLHLHHHPFFDPSSNPNPSSNHSHPPPPHHHHHHHHPTPIDQPPPPTHLNLNNYSCHPSNASTSTCSSSSSHQPRSPSSSSNQSRSTHSSNPSGQSSSTTLLNHPSEPDQFQDPPLYPRSTSSHLSPHHQFSPLNLYAHPSNPHPHQDPFPSKSLLLHRKNFFVFRNGASGIPKDGLHPNSTRHSAAGGGSGPGNRHPNPKSIQHRSQLDTIDAMTSVQVGEDAYFLRSDSLGVADGVGGWSGKPGANPGLFSSKLMHHCSVELARYEDLDDVHFLSYNSIDPVEILQQAFERSIHESKLEGLLGSSTALIAVLRDDELRIANLGDCCCSVIRGNDYIFRSEEQQHSFNYPVQIGTNSKSTPIKDAQRYKVKVQKDDIVILGSDGLADNLFDEDILEEVLKFTSNPTGHQSQTQAGDVGKPSSAQMISESLCLKARTVVEDQQAVTSPFSQRANEEGIHYVGGKNDDISVLVAIVGDQSDT